MARLRTQYRCSECGQAVPSWLGQCPACERWNTLESEAAGARDPGREARAGGTAVRLSDFEPDGAAPRPTGLPDLDRLLGGGLVPGSVTLVGGEPGAGKSTLLLQASMALAEAGGTALYASGEESLAQIADRAGRLPGPASELLIASATDLATVTDLAASAEPDLMIVDSIQTFRGDRDGAAAGSVAAVRDGASGLVELAKSTAVPVVMVGHVTKDGSLAGPKTLAHVVDTVLSLEGDRDHSLRLLRLDKHRFGTTDRLGVFEMTASGLQPIGDPSRLFLADRRPEEPGTAVVPAVDGGRPLLVEVQSLVVPTRAPVPRRTGQGLDGGRLGLVLAVLTKRIGVDFGAHDVWAAVAGGARISEPAADLGVALAVWSALCDRPVDPDTVVCGEVGLTGEIRQVSQIERRLAEAARLGFEAAVIPAGTPDLRPGSEARALELCRVSTVTEAAARVGLTSGSPFAALN